MILNKLLALCTLVVPHPALKPVSHSPEEYKMIAERFCFPEPDPKIGGFWVIAPFDAIAYSSVGCTEAIDEADVIGPVVHSWSTNPVLRLNIKLDK